jgi:peptidoglycan biosynthesis protein MviN/MurJ (putative lipid II flippase)
MTLFYPLPPGDGPALFVLRLVFGSAMAASIVLGIAAIMRRDFVRHGAWMTRGYAIGVAAGTQALTGLPWMLLVGPPDEPTRAALLGSAWLINVAVAEYVIRRRARFAETAGTAPARRNLPASRSASGDFAAGKGR